MTISTLVSYVNYRKLTSQNLFVLFLISVIACFPTAINAQINPAKDKTETTTEKYSKVKIRITSPDIKRFAAERLNVDHFTYEGNAMIVVLNSDEMSRLRQSHYPFEILIDDVVQHTIEINKNTVPANIESRAVIQGNGCQKVSTIIPTPAAFGTGGSLRLGAAAGNPGYFTYAEMSAAMLALQTANPGLVTRFSIGNSDAGTPIYGVKISDNVGTDENEPEVLFTGLQHAREAISGTSLIFYMQYLIANYGNTDQKIKGLVDNREIYIIPCMNPDGYLYNYSSPNPTTGGGLWRKNRRNTGGGASNIGVDLNRNYSVDWGNCAGASASCGSNVKTSDTYYGPNAFSEPETQALRDFVYARHFVNAIDQHCFGPYYSLPYGRPTLHPVLNHVDSSYYKFVPALMGLYNGHRAGNSPETVNYEVAGGIKDWLLLGDIGVGSGPKQKVYGMTGEAGGGDFWAPIAQIVQLCKENCFQNLQIAFAAGDYYDVNDRKDIAVNSLTGKFSFDIRRVGLGNGPVTISLIPILNIQSVGAPITTTLSTYYDTYIDSINYTLPVTVVCGKKIQYAWKVESGGIATYDTVTKYYNPVTLLSDDMEGTFSTNWTAAISPAGPSGWAFTTLAAFGGTKSMTESPTGNYTVSSTRTVTYNSTFNLSDATEAYLSFWVKHRSENFRDKLQVQVSTNGTTWIPICGTTTVTEDNTTNGGSLGGQPALTGIRDNWTRELFDLTGYKNNASVSLRFRFTSDNDASSFAFELDDGFYLDNVKVIKITNAAVPAPPAPASSNTTICTGNTATLSATGTAILGWYSAASGGTYLGGGSGYTTPVLTSTTTYYVQDSLCSPSATRTAVVVTVNQNSTLTLTSAVGTTSQSICNNNAITAITYAVGGGGTNASITAGALPAGITGSFSAGVFTIIGTATASGSYNYTLSTTGPCTNTSLSGTITVTPDATISLTSVTGTSSQTLCINNAITDITYAIGGSGTGAAITAGALPAGVTGSYNAGVYTISGTPTASGIFNYTVSSTGGSCLKTLSGTITVNANSTINLTSSGGTTAQAVCINNAIADITYAVGGSGTGASITAGALPAGVTGSYNAGVFTISGTATTSGTFSYTVTTTGPCINTSLSGTITVNANSTVSLISAVGTDAQTVCINNAIADITYAVGGSGTGASITAGALPTGVTGSYNAGVFTISGTATVSGTFSYTVTTTGPCVNTSLSGTITVNANSTIILSSAVGTDGQVLCSNSAITNITYAVGGSATGASITAGVLPAGVTGSYNAGVFTISGTPTVSGSYNYTITTTGPCTNPSLSGLITINLNGTISLTSAPGSDAQVVCSNSAIANIAYGVGGAGSGTVVTGLPVGVTGSFNAGVFTISGTPTVSGVYNYTVTTTGGSCAQGTANGTITVNAVTLTFTKNNVSVCGTANDASITVTPAGGTAPYIYSWTGSNGYTAGNTASITNLAVGYYNVFVTDAIGCTATIANIHIENAFSVYITSSGTISSSCSPTGSIILYGNAGVQPYTYSIDGTNYQAGNTFTGLAAGSYTGYVKDAAGCVSTKPVTISAAAPIVVTSSVKNTSNCANDGSIEIFRSGGIAPYTYSLDNITYQVLTKFLNLAPGSYTAYVKDSKGCIGSQAITVTQAAPISVTTNKLNSSTCINDGAIQANASGGTAPYTYSLNFGSFQPGNSFTGLGAGSYTITVKDVKGCTGTTSVSIGLNQIVVTAYASSASTCLTSNGLIQLFRTGGYGPYTYSLDGTNYQSSPVFNNRTAGIYIGHVKDSKGCIGTLTGIVVGPTNCGEEFTSQQNNMYVKKPSLNIQAYPNPSTTEFTLVLENYNNKEKISISVTDVLGRKIYLAEGSAGRKYMIGKNFKTGIYMVEVVQGENKQSIKLVKE